MQLSVIIVNHNVRPFLEQCLRTVLAALNQVHAEVIVVDNASADDSITILQPLFPRIHFIRSETNLGFSKANNLGAAKAIGKYLLFLNPDTLIAENTLQRCLLYLEQHPEVGAAGVKMINGFGKYLPESKRTIPSLRNSFFKLSGLAGLFPKSGVLNGYAMGQLSGHEIHKVPVLTGAFMMVHRSLFESLGGFDPAFFMYGEDIDFCLRMYQAGHHIHYLGNISIIHYKGQSSRSSGYRQTVAFYKAMEVFVLKHYHSGKILIPFIRIAGFLARIKKWLSTNNKITAITNGKKNTMLICHADRVEEIRKRLAEHQQDDCLLGSISSVRHSHRNGPDVSSLILAPPIKQLIIGIPDISMQEAIQLMERHEGIFFRFQFLNSHSLTFNNP